MSLIKRMFETSPTGGSRGGWLTSLNLFEGMKDISRKSVGLGTFDFEKYCDKMDTYYLNYPKVKSMVLSIAGQVMAEGLFVQPATKKNAEGKAESNARSEKAAELCDDLNEQIALDEATYENSLKLTKYGSTFMEKTFEPFFGARILPHMKYIRPNYDKATKKLVGWSLIHRNTPLATYSNDEILPIRWDINRNDPFGTSMLTGIDRELTTKDEIIEGMKAYLKNNAWAAHLIQVGDEHERPGPDTVDKVKYDLKNRRPGQALVTSFKIDAKTLGTGDVETRMIPDTIAYLNDEITDALLVPPISKLYNSTEASAKVMTAWTRAVIITPMQRIFKRRYETGIYWPYLESLGYSRRNVPTLAFNPPETGREEEATYWVTLVKAGIASRQVAAAELGIPWEEPEVEKPEEEEEEKNRQFEEYVIHRTRRR